MKKYTKPLLAIAVLLLIAIVVYFTTEEKILYNEGYVNGNTTGNLYNGGLVCENNGKLFFANPSDGNRLYSMNIDGTGLKKISDDVANYINADDHYVYYVRNNVGDSLDYEFFSFYRNALCRIPRDGGTASILDTDPCNYATLVGNYIYYLHYDKEDASTLYKVKIDGTDKKQVRDDAIYTCNTEGQYIYYNGMINNGDIYRFDTTSDSATLLYPGNCFKPTAVNNGNEIYYIDGNQNGILVYAKTNSNHLTPITSDSVDAYNLSDGEIYFQKYDKENSGIYVVKTDGTGEQLIQKGDYKNIHVTSTFVFFTDYHTDIVYYIQRNEPSNVKPFRPGTAK